MKPASQASFATVRRLISLDTLRYLSKRMKIILLENNGFQKLPEELSEIPS